MVAESSYQLLKETKNYLVYEPVGPTGVLIGNLYVAKGELQGEPGTVTVSVKASRPKTAPKGKG